MNKTNRVILFTFLWALILSVLAFVVGKFYFFSLGLIPLAIYEFIRTEGKKNTKPLSLLTIILLIFQFLHTSKILIFPIDVTFLIKSLPVPVPVDVDPFLFMSIVLLIVFSLLLIKYTWGSITKFLAIGLLVGSLVQASVYWPEIQMMINTPEGQQLLEGQSERIKDNLLYRLRQEL